MTQRAIFSAEEIAAFDSLVADFDARTIEDGIVCRWDVTWGPPIPKTWLGRKMLQVRVLRYRIRDAWEVLRGRAYID